MSLNRPKVYFVSVIIFVFVVFILSTETSFGVLATFDLQGRVLSQSGQVVPDGTYPMTFRIYEDRTGGSAVWVEAKNNASGGGVLVKDGLFNVTLGANTSLSGIDFSSGDFFLSIEFNYDGEMDPRKQLSSVPFSLYTSSLNDKTSSDFVLKRGDTMLGRLNLDKHDLTTTGKVVAGGFWEGTTSLDDIYLKLSGGTISGNLSLTGKLTVGNGLTVSSGSITLPQSSIASSALPTTISYLGSSIESSEITDGTIANADISNTAGIAYSKLNIPDSSLTMAKTSGLQAALDSKLNLSGGILTSPITVSGVSGLTDTDIPDDLTITSTKRIQTTLTTEQMRLSYNPSAYATFTVNSSGDLTIAPTSGSTFLISGIDTGNLALAGAEVNESRGINIARIINSGDYYGLYNNLKKQGTGTGAVYGVYNKMRDTTLIEHDIRYTAYGVYNELTTTYDGEAYGVKTVSTSDTDTGTIYAYASDLTQGSPTTKYNLYLKGASNYLYNTGEQLRILFNDSNYLSITVSNTGSATFDMTGDIAPALWFGDRVTFNADVSFPSTTRHLTLSAKDCEDDSGSPTAINVGKFPVWKFSDAQTDAIRCVVDIPDDWSSGTNMNIKIVYSGDTITGLGNYVVKWDLAGNAVNDNLALPTANAFSGSETHSSSYPSANLRKVSEAIVIDSSGWAANDTSIGIKISRDGNDVGDTYTGNADLHLIQLWYTSITPKSSG